MWVQLVSITFLATITSHFQTTNYCSAVGHNQVLSYYFSSHLAFLRHPHTGILKQSAFLNMCVSEKINICKLHTSSILSLYRHEYITCDLGFQNLAVVWRANHAQLPSTKVGSILLPLVYVCKRSKSVMCDTDAINTIQSHYSTHSYILQLTVFKYDDGTNTALYVI